jgi:hypothetical protein
VFCNAQKVYVARVNRMYFGTGYSDDRRAKLLHKESAPMRDSATRE